MSEHTLLTKEEELNYFKEYRKGDRSAYEKLFNSQVRLVKLIIFRDFKKFKFLFDDLISESYLLIHTAIEDFDPTLNNRLSTLVGKIVYNNIKKYIRKNYCSINMPQNNQLPNFTVYNQNDENNLDDLEGKDYYFKEEINFDCLTDHEKYVIDNIYFKFKTNNELSEEMQVSKQAVSYTKMNALKKLRNKYEKI